MFNCTIHYKFKSSNKVGAVSIEGSTFVSYEDLVALICTKEKITTDSLKLINPQTSEEYKTGSTINKNSSVLVQRVPSQRIHSTPTLTSMSSVNAEKSELAAPRIIKNNANVAKSEEDKISDLVNNASDWSNHFIGQKASTSQTIKVVPPSYICFRCKQKGHHIKNCPTNGDPKYDVITVRGTAGIPKEFLKTKSNTSASNMLQPGFGFVEMAPNEAEFNKLIAISGVTAKESEVPDELKCPLCDKLYNNVVLIPCCGNSFCSECIQQALIDNEEDDFKCPSCSVKNVKLDNLYPNVTLRKTVDKYKLSLQTKVRSSSPVNVNSTNIKATSDITATTKKSETKKEDTPALQNAQKATETTVQPENTNQPTDTKKDEIHRSPKQERDSVISKNPNKEKIQKTNNNNYYQNDYWYYNSNDFNSYLSYMTYLQTQLNEEYMNYSQRLPSYYGAKTPLTKEQFILEKERLREALIKYEPPKDSLKRDHNQYSNTIRSASSHSDPVNNNSNGHTNNLSNHKRKLYDSDQNDTESRHHDKKRKYHSSSEEERHHSNSHLSTKHSGDYSNHVSRNDSHLHSHSQELNVYL